MTKEIKIKVSDKDYDFIQRIAKSEKRRLADFAQLLFAEGLDYFFCDQQICFKKHDDELTEEEHKQIKINDELAKQEGWYQLDYEEKVVQGYKQVFEWWENHAYNYETKKHDDNLIKPTVKSIQSFAIEEKD
tara:strand:- start:424 stop:819 length:396 start_codon:yes stop_codon:yes gene_type:complete